MPNKPLCRPMTSHKITQGGGWVERKTKQYTISGERSSDKRFSCSCRVGT